MTSPTLPRSDYYVYGLFRETGSIFYIGKGRDRRRINSATVNGSRKNPLKARAVKKTLGALGEVPVVILAEGLTEDEAFALERLFIRAIGRLRDGPLINMTDGGDGFVDPTGAIRAKIRQSLTGRKHTPEARENMRLSHLGHSVSQETRDKMRAIMRERFPLKEKPPKKLTKTYTPERKARWIAALKAKTRTTEQRENYRRAATGRTHSDATKEKIRELRRGSKDSPATRAKKAIASTGRTLSAASRAQLSRNKKGWNPSEETRRRMSEGQRRRYGSTENTKKDQDLS